MSIEHRFVEHIPETLEPGVIYVSLPYATAVHLCPCGCGNQVVTPLSPTDWSLTFNGEAVSLDPSIGNWSFPCKSHYWIDAGEVVWSYRYTAREIGLTRRRETVARERYYRRKEDSE